MYAEDEGIGKRLNLSPLFLGVHPSSQLWGRDGHNRPRKGHFKSQFKQVVGELFLLCSAISVLGDGKNGARFDDLFIISSPSSSSHNEIFLERRGRVGAFDWGAESGTLAITANSNNSVLNIDSR